MSLETHVRAALRGARTFFTSNFGKHTGLKGFFRLLKIMKEKKFADNEMIKAEKKAKYFAQMFGQMPHFLKKYTNKIFIHRYNGKGEDLKAAWAPWKKKEFR